MKQEDAAGLFPKGVKVIWVLSMTLDFNAAPRCMRCPLARCTSVLHLNQSKWRQSFKPLPSGSGSQQIERSMKLCIFACNQVLPFQNNIQLCTQIKLTFGSVVYFNSVRSWSLLQHFLKEIHQHSVYARKGPWLNGLLPAGRGAGGAHPPSKVMDVV